MQHIIIAEPRAPNASHVGVTEHRVAHVSHDRAARKVTQGKITPSDGKCRAPRHHRNAWVPSLGRHELSERQMLPWFIADLLQVTEHRKSGTRARE
jgi:hypothetical protein